MEKRFMMLEDSVFRRDDQDSFPDDTKAPIRASATTSWGARFSIAFHIAQPPSISRLYAQLPQPGFLPPHMCEPLAMLATHRHLALFRVSTLTPEEMTEQNFFIYNAHKNPDSSLKRPPPCTEPDFDITRRDGRLPRRNPCAPTSPRLLSDLSMGLWCRGNGDEFVVAELSLFGTNKSEIFADICFLKSSCTSAKHQLGGTWNSKRVPILYHGNPNQFEVYGTKPNEVVGIEDDVLDFKCIVNDAWLLYCWSTDVIIPCIRWLCWVDYHRGILFCDLSSKDKDPTPTVSFLRFPLQDFPRTRILKSTLSFLYRGVSAVDDGRALKFINVARDDGIAYGALKPGASFTITCHTLELRGDSMGWKWKPADYKVTSCELWNDKYPVLLPREILMYPQVDIDMPSVVHFLLSDFGHVNRKIWVVSIDMRKKVVDTSSPYINGNEGLETDDAGWIKAKSMNPTRFLPCEFPKFFNFSSKRKHMG